MATKCASKYATNGAHEWSVFTSWDSITRYRGVGIRCNHCDETHEQTEDTVIAWFVRKPITRAARKPAEVQK